jgi:Domain of unknown function (DUF4872)/Butirosin biosynthesis protein H, N-terminal
MTERKHLKRLIRARMARTGESYATARMHTIGAGAHGNATLAPEPGGTPPPAPAEPGLLPGYQRFGGGEHHDSALLHNLLLAAGVRAQHSGQPYSEAMLAGLGGGVGFMCFAFEYADHHPTMTIVARHHPDPFIPAMLARSGARHDTRQGGGAAVAERHLREALAGGRAVLCAVSRAELPWHRRVDAMGDADPHEIVVVGIDEAAGEALIDDGCERPNRLALDRLAEARARYRKGKRRLMTVTGRELEDGFELEASVREAIAACAHHLTEPVLGNAFDTNFGFRGMERWIAQLTDERTRQGWLRRYDHPEALFTALYRLHDCIEVEYSAPGAMRPLYADFLVEVADLLAAPALLDAAERFRAAGERWSAIANQALDPTVPQLARYHDLTAELAELRRTRGWLAAGEIAALGEEVGTLARSFAADDPIPRPRRSTLFGELAALASEVMGLERDAVDALHEVVAPGR